MITGLPAALTSSGIDFDFRFSPDGSHHIVPVDIDTSSLDDGAIVLDGAGLVLGGTLVQEDNLIPVAVGGTGDAWDNFDYCGITNSGEYVFTGDTDGDSATDEFICRNGTIWAREGDVLDGETLSGFIEGASLNNNGELAFIWDVVNVGGATDEALYFEDTLLLRAGDNVDWDGDGVVDMNRPIVSFTGTNTLALADDGTIYFTADIDVDGSTLEGYFVLGDGGLGTNYCMANPNSTGAAGVISAAGSSNPADNDVTLMASSLPLNAFGFFITSQTQGFVANPAGSAGNLCLIGSIGRYVGAGQIQNSGATGTFSLVLDLTMTPQPMSTVSIMSGETWNFQGWHRDSVNGMATSNFTDGLSIDF